MLITTNRVVRTITYQGLFLAGYVPCDQTFKDIYPNNYFPIDSSKTYHMRLDRFVTDSSDKHYLKIRSCMIVQEDTIYI